MSQSLTSRESELVAAIKLGLPNKEIAFRFGTSESTVKVQVCRLFHKLGKSRFEIAIDALMEENRQLRAENLRLTELLAK